MLTHVQKRMPMEGRVNANAAPRKTSIITSTSRIISSDISCLVAIKPGYKYILMPLHMIQNKKKDTLENMLFEGVKILYKYYLSIEMVNVGNLLAR